MELTDNCWQIDADDFVDAIDMLAEEAAASSSSEEEGGGAARRRRR